MGWEENKEKIKKWWDETRQDKKKVLIIVLLPLIIIAAILVGLISGGKDPENQQRIAAEGVIVPTDSVVAEKQKGKSETYMNDFFSESDENVSVSKEARAIESENNSNDESFKGSYKPISHESSGLSNSGSSYSGKSIKKNSTITEEPVPVASQPEGDKKRRRAPSDGMGNLSAGSGKTMYSAVVANSNKTVKSGSYVSIRVAEDIVIDGMKVPRNSIITGVASYGGERMNIDIKSVKIGNVTKTVKWIVVDEDGNDGIAVPQSILNDIARDGSDGVIENEGSKVEGNLPVVGSIKVNLKKKNKEVSFVISNGHRIYIKERKI